MSIGTIILIILVIALLGGFSGIGGGPFYGTGYYGGGGLGLVIVVLLILLLLYANFGSIRDSLLAFSAIPMAIIGGVLALALTGTAFSISSAIGFVALFGIAVMDGILVVTTYNQAIDEYGDRPGALATTVRHSLRPVVMTCLVAAIGLLPAALSNGIGSQVQKPLALVVVGGMSLAPLLILLVLPVLIDRFSRRVQPSDRGAHGRDVSHPPLPAGETGEVSA
jgi:cobalt-zinc-cadmium resistance protein CzcA